MVLTDSCGGPGGAPGGPGGALGGPDNLHGGPDNLPTPSTGGVLRSQDVKPLPRIARDRSLTRALRENDSVITRGGLVRLGFSRDEILGLIAHGELRRMHRSVYVDGRARVTDRAYLRAALLAFGGRAWLSGWAGAMAWELIPLTVPRLEVSVAARSTPQQRSELRVRSVRRPPHPSEIRARNGLRLSSVPRLLIEISATGGSREQLDTLIEAAVRHNRLDVHDLAATLARHAGCRGTAKLKLICSEYLPRADRKSGLERSFDRWCAKHPEIPEPQRNIKLGPWEIDCYWPDHQLVVELDGRSYHTLVADIERDNRKNTWLQTHRIGILRVTDFRWRSDRRGVYRDLITLLELGAPVRSPH